MHQDDKAKTMMRTTLVLASLIVSAKASLAQNLSDAVRYSQTATGGTALSTGMGGAIGAVGGDFSSASVNPAGLGLYRQSELAGSLSIFNFSGTSDYFGSSQDDRKFNFNIPNFHLVLHSPNANRLKTKGWLSTTFGFGYNKGTNYSEQWTLRGDNPYNSIVNRYILDAGNKSPDDLNPFGSYLAYQTYLIDPYTDPATGAAGYTSLRVPLNGGLAQRGSMNARGRSGETDFSFAANYSNRLYLGATLAIRRIVNERTFTYKEETDTFPTFTSLNLIENQLDKGTSVGLRAGAIYRITDFFRVGAAALLPLDYTINTKYNSELSTDLGGDLYEAVSPDGSYKYKFRTPARFTGSAAFVIKKSGIISIDYEMVDYRKTRFADAAGSFDDINDLFLSTFKRSGNLRIGGELRFDDLYVRGGWQMIGSPYANDTNRERSMQQFSAGFGYRVSDFFMDFSYTFGMQKTQFAPYSHPGLSVLPVASQKFITNNIAFTIGTRF